MIELKTEYILSNSKIGKQQHSKINSSKKKQHSKIKNTYLAFFYKNYIRRLILFDFGKSTILSNMYLKHIEVSL
jgi:pectate lyase